MSVFSAGNILGAFLNFTDRHTARRLRRLVSCP